MDPYLAEVRLFSFQFAPRGWALCNGALLSVAQNTALFSLLGTTFGGNGQTTFALPNLQGRVPVHPGSGTGLPAVVAGQVDGTESVTLTVAQMPQHTHTLFGVNAAADKRPAGTYSFANDSTVNADFYAAESNPLVVMDPATVGVAGGNQSHSNIQPYLALNYCIALTGIYPTRN